MQDADDDDDWRRRLEPGRVRAAIDRAPMINFPLFVNSYQQLDLIVVVAIDVVVAVAVAAVAVT